MKKRVIILGVILLAALSMIALMTIPLTQNLTANDNPLTRTPNPDSSSNTVSGGQGTISGNNIAGTGGNSGSSEGVLENPTYCTEESREVEECEPNDHPVCGWFDEEQVECEEDPCVRSTFPNECEACINPDILYWTESECPIHQ